MGRLVSEYGSDELAGGYRDCRLERAEDSLFLAAAWGIVMGNLHIGTDWDRDENGACGMEKYVEGSVLAVYDRRCSGRRYVVGHCFFVETCARHGRCQVVYSIGIVVWPDRYLFAAVFHHVADGSGLSFSVEQKASDRQDDHSIGSFFGSGIFADGIFREGVRHGRLV